ncbi:hypothetical protein D4R71_08545 [bacterium]|nr:MAG: hypothetical protein D4R71_08545 [bacterium]
MRKLLILLFSIKLILSLISCDKTTGPNNQTTVTDIDGNIYKTVKIGDQVWMAENLRVTHYRNGEPIPNLTANNDWTWTPSGAYCVYDNNPLNAESYGNLYNWLAVDDICSLAPGGWHIPTDEEWQILIDYLGGGTIAGGKMKEIGTIEVGDGIWHEPNTGATNESGFKGLPGGYRYLVSGEFKKIGYYSYFWSSSGSSVTTAWSWSLRNDSQGVGHVGVDKRYGYSVRCIRNNGANQPPDKPTNPSPVDNSDSISIYTNLSWTCTDPNDDPLLYNVYFGFSSNPPLVKSGLNETTYNPGILSEETTYTWRIKAYDDHGNFTMGNLWEFTTTNAEASTVKDIDGNVYQTIQIGEQVWMAENLKVTCYRNGDPIPHITDHDEWINTTSGAYCVYWNNPTNADTYGNLYNWYAVDDSRGLAPQGWHVPTDDDWKELEMHLGMTQTQADSTGYRGTNEGSKLAGMGKLWYTDVLENNSEFGSSGFTALPGGRHDYSGFYYWGFGAHFWSSHEFNSNLAWYRILNYIYTEVYRYSTCKIFGFSVRCVRD